MERSGKGLSLDVLHYMRSSVIVSHCPTVISVYVVEGRKGVACAYHATDKKPNKNENPVTKISNFFWGLPKEYRLTFRCPATDILIWNIRKDISSIMLVWSHY